MQNKIEIAKMSYKDCAQVAQIDALSIANAWKEEDFCNAVDKEQQCYLVAKEGEQVIGFVGMIQALDEADITHIAVHPSFRGRQIATMLLDSLMEQAKKRLIHAIFLEVRESNEPAKALYAKMQFEVLAIRKNYYKNPVENAIIMKKTL